MLTQGQALGFVPGFISDHSYMQAPGQESDSTLLLDTVSDPNSVLDWSTRHADYEALLKEILGSRASGVQVMATEFNSVYSNPGKQSTSLVNGLFIADSIGSLLDSGYTGGFVWDLRNGWSTTGNNSPSLYGWRQGGDYGLLGDPNTSDPPATGPYVPYPSYFAEQLAAKIVQGGGKVVSASSNFQDLAAYAVLEADGHLDLLVINKDPDAALNEQFTVRGFTPSGQAHVWQYGEAQDYAQSQTTNGSGALATFTSTVASSGGTFNYTFPAYSMTVLDLAPATVATATLAGPSDGYHGVDGQTRAFAPGASHSSASAPQADFTYTFNWHDGTPSNPDVQRQRRVGYPGLLGTTNYDMNDAALAAILAEWESADVYNTRFYQLEGQERGRPNGSYDLIWDTTVNDTNDSDTLVGSAEALDWLFAQLSGKHADVIHDRNAPGHEHVNNTDCAGQ